MRMTGRGGFASQSDCGRRLERGERGPTEEPNLLAGDDDLRALAELGKRGGQLRRGILGREQIGQFLAVRGALHNG